MITRVRQHKAQLIIEFERGEMIEHVEPSHDGHPIAMTNKGVYDLFRIMEEHHDERS